MNAPMGDAVASSLMKGASEKKIFNTMADKKVDVATKAEHRPEPKKEEKKDDDDDWGAVPAFFATFEAEIKTSQKWQDFSHKGEP